MKTTCIPLLFSAIILLAPVSHCQFESFFADFGMDCIRGGVNLGLFPDIEDWWFINVPCRNYGGSVRCQSEDPDIPGLCGCNLGEQAYFNQTSQICLGKVGATCTAEKTSLVPAKECTPNSDCIAVQGEGYTVGTCQCLYGYKEENGMCVVDENIGDGDRATRRTTTTTEAPDSGSFKLPPLDLLLGGHTVTLGEQCQGQDLIPLLNRTYCNTYGHTAACIDKRCKCNMADDDTIFDEELDQCVGRVGSFCLTRQNLLGYKGCTAGADCFLEAELQVGQSFGTCQCLYGYDPEDDGTCVRNPDIDNPSTRAPGGPTPAPPPTTPPAPRQSTPGGAPNLTTSIILIFAVYLSVFIIG